MRRRSVAVPLGAAVAVCLMPVQATAWQTKLDLKTGYRIDELRWHIAGNTDGSRTPNILSELTWDDLRIAKIGAAWRATDTDGMHFRALLDYGWIHDGRNRDSDYSGNDRTNEWSRSENDANNDAVVDAAAAVGYRLRGLLDGIDITPLVGISHHRQNLRMTNGHQTVSRPELRPSGLQPPPPVGPFAGLNSTYKTRWTGPWIGAEINTDIGTAARAFVQLAYHWARYDAEADWNLRTEPETGFQHPKSFEHDANGRGRVIAVGVSVPIAGRWSARAALDYQKWDTYAGIHRVFLNDGTQAVMPLNEVEWASRALSLGLELRF